jgi:hypothetical protein
MSHKIELTMDGRATLAETEDFAKMLDFYMRRVHTVRVVDTTQSDVTQSPPAINSATVPCSQWDTVDTFCPLSNDMRCTSEPCKLPAQHIV